jgi:hypothetical protein
MAGVRSMQPSSDNRGRIAVAEDVRVSLHEDGLVLLHIPTGSVFLCNRTGSRIWEGLVRGLSPDAIGEELRSEYRVAYDVLQEHIRSFVSELEIKGFLLRTARS